MIHKIKRRKANWSIYIVRSKYLLKHFIEGKIEGRENEEGDVSNYWVTLRKWKGTGNSRRKH